MTMSDNFFTLRHLNGEEEFDWSKALSAARVNRNPIGVSDLLKYKCPTCDGYIPNNKTPGAYPGALSRVDNETEICSECGTREALLGVEQTLDNRKEK
jgi:hypothetical protein